MKFAALPRIKKIASLASLALALAVGPVAPSTATAGVLSDLLVGLSVTEGCSSFVGPYGSSVPVRYFLPKGGCAAPAVLFLHGSDGGHRYMSDYEKVGRGLAAEGYATFMVHYYEGAPNALRPGPNDRGLPDPGAFFPWVATVKQAVSYVQSFPGVDPARIGIMGMSLGGFVGSSVAANDPRVRSLVVLSAGMPDLYAEKMGYMPPTLIIHGDRDADVPVTEAYKLGNRLASRGIWHKLDILACEGHLPYQPYNTKIVAAKVLAFFDQTL